MRRLFRGNVSSTASVSPGNASSLSTSNTMIPPRGMRGRNSFQGESRGLVHVEVEIEATHYDVWIVPEIFGASLQEITLDDFNLR